MASITLKGNPIHTSGHLPQKGSAAPYLSLVKSNLSEATLENYGGKRKVLNIFPSIDTGVCAASVRRFNKEASSLNNTVVLCISADLPFAHQRFCSAEGLDKVETLSCFRTSFAQDYGVKIVDGPLAGLCSRAIVVLDEKNVVVYTEQVPEIAQEPDYGKVLAALAQ
jgi:thiol peroxidase